MITGLNPFPNTFPRLAIPWPNVSSPLTCRHPKPLRCSCHGQSAPAPAHTPQAAAEASANSPTAAPATAPPAATAKIQEVESQFQNILLKIGHVLLRFPDARDAVNELLHQLLGRQPNFPDSAQPAEGT